jgi:membrane protease YdiL (CAAX protease family)
MAIPAAAIAAVLLISRWRGIAWKQDLGLVWPKPGVVAAWLAIWAAWVVLGEIATRTLGLADAAPWKPYPPHIVLMRIAAIGLLGPAAEEIVVRGILYYRIAKTRVGPLGAVVIGAALWAVAHVQYDGPTVALIFADGLVLGAARHRSRSTFVPMLLHAVGNLYSIGQSLTR